MITKKKKLRSGETVWMQHRAPKIAVRELPDNLQADVLVVGAGITGAMVAEELADAGFKVAVVDRRGALKGSTMATTALLQYEIDEPLVKLKDMIGMDDAARAWRRSKLGLESLAAKVEALGIKCDMRRKSSLYLSGNILDADRLEEEMTLRNSIGLHTEFLGRKDLLDGFGIKRSAALKSFDNLAANPIKLAAGMMLSAMRKGAKVFAPVNISEIEPVGDSVLVRTSYGREFKVKHVVFATGYEIPQYIKTKKHTVNSTWAIATKKQKRKLWPEQSFIWEASEPYLYMRTTADGRVICGGEDEEFSDEELRDALIEQKTATLEKKLKEIFPQIDSRAEFSWTGSFGGSETGLPSIGAIPGMKNCYAIMAFGGNGITYSRIAAEIIRSALTGLDDPEKDLFAFK